MENSETNMQGAARETAEEANAEVDNMQLFCVYSIAHINQVYTMYRGDLVGGKASPGIESLETALLKENEIPWQELAFQVISETLKQYYRDQMQGEFQTHYGDIIKHDDGSFTVDYC